MLRLIWFCERCLLNSFYIVPLNRNVKMFRKQHILAYKINKDSLVLYQILVNSMRKLLYLCTPFLKLYRTNVFHIYYVSVLEMELRRSFEKYKS